MTDIEKTKRLINEADAIIIGAGAGLSTSAGIDYSRESFKKNFPELVLNYGMTDMYTSSFYDFNTEEERWSYWAKHINYSFIAPPPLRAYKELLEIVKIKTILLLLQMSMGNLKNLVLNMIKYLKFKVVMEKCNVLKVAIINYMMILNWLKKC